MAYVESLQPNEHDPFVDRAIYRLNEILLDAASIHRNDLGNESARRILEAEEKGHSIYPGIDPILIEKLKANIGRYSNNISVIPALRTIEDFPIDTDVYFHQPGLGNTKFLETKVLKNDQYPTNKLVLRFSEVLILVNPGYVGLLNAREFDQLGNRPRHGNVTPTHVNLIVSHIMTIAGFGDYCDEETFKYMKRYVKLSSDSSVLDELYDLRDDLS
jgi:hypothetical protein